MVKVYEGTPDEFYMDGYLKFNLDTAKKVIQRDWDMIFAVDGREGSGKSVFACQIAKYCDIKFNISQITFTSVQFKQAITSAQPYSSVVYDEAYTGLNARATMSFVNRTLVTMLAEIRQKNLFVFVVMPSFFDLDKYVALHRSRALFHCYTGKDFSRGYFSFYNEEKKKDLYLNGKKLYSYLKPRPNFIGRFTNHYVVDEKEYRKLKLKNLDKREQDRVAVEQHKQFKDDLFEHVWNLHETEGGFTHDMAAKILNMSISNYWLTVRKYKEKLARGE